VFSLRIVNHPILTFPKQVMVTFTLNGQAMEGVAGEPIAAALHAADVKILSHSPNQHRPRGIFCAIGNCSSCLMTVDGVPNVRVCIEPLRAGMAVEVQTGKGKIL
jgi:predicted molibdopterin-dependent oxidoreductase YjgC